MTPYRISAREPKTRDAAPATLATSLRLAAASFTAVAIAAALAMGLVNTSHDVRSSISVSIWIDRAFAVAIPLLVLAIGARAAKGARVRSFAFATSGLWLVTLLARIPQIGERESNVVALAIAIAHVLAIGGVALLPSLAASRHVVPRWPVFAAIALAVGDAADQLALGRHPVLLTQVRPSLTTLVLFALMAWTFYGAARELAGETIDDAAARLGENAPSLFPDPRARAGFLGPVRLATEAALAFAIVTVAHGRAFRLDAPTVSVESAALVVLSTAALLWQRRSARGGSAAPLVASVAACVAMIASVWSQSVIAFDIGLLPFGLAILGLGVVAPRTTDPDTRTMRRWVKLVSATGVMFASAGFFALYSASCGQGEPGLAQLAKLGAVVFGAMAANASLKIERHSRIELAAADREP